MLVPPVVVDAPVCPIIVVLLSTGVSGMAVRRTEMCGPRASQHVTNRCQAVRTLACCLRLPGLSSSCSTLRPNSKGRSMFSLLRHTIRIRHITMVNPPPVAMLCHWHPRVRATVTAPTRPASSIMLSRLHHPFPGQQDRQAQENL